MAQRGGGNRPVGARRAGRVASSAVMFVLVSVVMGVLVAGLAVPFAAMAVGGGRTAADGVDLLPAELDTPPLPERSRVLAGDGSVLAYFYDENRVYVPLEDIAPVMRRAQVAIEDHRFYQHGALDVMGTLRALVRNGAGGATQGGSSITQQYVKLVQVEKAKASGDEDGVRAAQAKSYSRKIQEMRYAIALERRLSKDEILERYLNIAYFGDGAYGVEQAARHYFGTSARDLEVAEAAMLAGLVQNPTATDPRRFPRAAVARRNVVLDRMADPEIGIISRAQAETAKRTTWDPDRIRPVRNGCVGSEFPFLCDYVRRTLLQNPGLGPTVAARESLLLRGGLTISTKIDKASQRIAEKAIAKLVDPKDPVISTMTMIEPGTGLIMAMAQSRPEMGSRRGQTFYNYAVPQSLGGAEGFQAGSTFKAYTAAAALEQGIPMSQRYDAPSTLDFSDTRFESCDGPVRVPPGYRPRNSTRSGADMSMAYAMDWSVNTYFLQLGRDAGLCNVTKMMDRLGVELASGEPMTTQSSIFSLPLGSVDVTPLSMTVAYATLAADGVHCNPVIVQSVTTRAGRKVEVPGAGCRRVMDADVARGVTSLLEGVMRGTGAPAALDTDHDIAGKTGATDSSEAVWFCGYSPEMAGCSSIAVDKTHDYWKDRRRSLTGLVLPGGGGVLSGDGGGDAGAQIWKPAMSEALQGRDPGRFTEPSDEIRTGPDVDIPDVTGMPPDQAEQALERAGFRVVRTMISNATPRGTYLGSAPTGRAKQSSTVHLYFSAGPAPDPDDQQSDDEKPDDEKPDDGQPGGGEGEGD